MEGSSIVLALDEVLFASVSDVVIWKLWLDVLFGVEPLDSLLEPGLEPVLDVLDAVFHVLVELIFTALVVLPDSKTPLAVLLVV